ncbi:MAG: NAD(P)-dependent alcohol dehydrogenase [Pleomorphochaeta sp.]
MKALVLEEVNKITMREIEIKEELSPNDVRVEPQCVGICGSDVHYYKYGKIGDFVVKEPMVLGHEASGIVTEVGSNVKHLKVGDRVCMEPGIPNFQSSETMNGMYNLDPEVKFWATPPIHGCLRESFVHPGILTFKLPDNVSFEEGAAVEPVAIGMYSAKKAQLEPGDTALVMGAGTIGIVTAISALASGCSKVIISDIKDDKLDIVRKNYPSIICVNSQKEDLDQIIKDNTINGVDVFFEATGAKNILTTFTKFVRPGGRAVLIGMPIEPVKLDVVGCQAKEITLFTIFRYVNMFEKSLRLISSKTLNVKPLITHNYSFDDAIEAFEFAATEPGDAIKIMLHK